MHETFGGRSNDRNDEEDLNITFVVNDKKGVNHTTKQNCRARLDNLKLKSTTSTNIQKRAAITKILLDEEDTQNKSHAHLQLENNTNDLSMISKYQTANQTPTPLSDMLDNSNTNDSIHNYPTLLDVKKSNPFINKRLSIIKKTYKLQASLSPMSRDKGSQKNLNLTQVQVSQANNLNTVSTSAFGTRRHYDTQNIVLSNDDTQSNFQSASTLVNMKTQKSQRNRNSIGGHPIHHRETHMNSSQPKITQFNQTATIQTSEVSQRYMIQGAKGSVLAEQVKDLREKVKMLEKERDKYESFFNQAQYEKKTKDDNIKVLQGAIEMRVDTICTKMGYTNETNQSMDDTPGNVFVDMIKLKNELDCEKKLRQKMADRVSELQRQLTSDKKRIEEHKFIRENDNQEIIRLEKELQNFTQTVVRLEREKYALKEQLEQVNKLLQDYESKQSVHFHEIANESQSVKQQSGIIKIQKCEQEEVSQQQQYKSSQVEEAHQSQFQIMQAAIMELKQNYDQLKQQVGNTQIQPQTLSLPSHVSIEIDNKAELKLEDILGNNSINQIQSDQSARQQNLNQNHSSTSLSFMEDSRVVFQDKINILNQNNTLVNSQVQHNFQKKSSQQSLARDESHSRKVMIAKELEVMDMQNNFNSLIVKDYEDDKENAGSSFDNRKSLNNSKIIKQNKDKIYTFECNTLEKSSVLSSIH
eukprot:403369540